MKTYTFKNIISGISFTFAIISFILAILCMSIWTDFTYSVISAGLTVAYTIVGFCAACGAKEDYYDYLVEKQLIKDNLYDRLLYMYKKYCWKLDLNSTVPSFNDKKRLLEWSADVAVACQVYQHDYNTLKTSPQVNQDLELMIELAQNLIDNKKYI